MNLAKAWRSRQHIQPSWALILLLKILDFDLLPSRPSKYHTYVRRTQNRKLADPKAHLGLRPRTRNHFRPSYSPCAGFSSYILWSKDLLPRAASRLQHEALLHQRALVRSKIAQQTQRSCETKKLPFWRVCFWLKQRRVGNDVKENDKEEIINTFGEWDDGLVGSGDDNEDMG